MALLPLVAPDAASAESSAGRIVFESDPHGHRDIWIMDADGSNAEALTDDRADDVFPAWSPDGLRVAWSRGVKGVYEIWVMNTDGSDKAQITFNGVRSRVPTWSPDGERIAFGRSGDLWVMDADGSDQQQLTSGPNLDFGPRWSPVDDRIAFFSDRNGGSAVYTVRSDGTQITQMTPDALNAGAPELVAGRGPAGLLRQLLRHLRSRKRPLRHGRRRLEPPPAHRHRTRQRRRRRLVTRRDPHRPRCADPLRQPPSQSRHSGLAVDGGGVVYLTRTLGIDEQHPDWSPA